MNGRQIQHVEAHRRHVGQAGFHVLQRAMTTGLVRRRSWKHLIPCAESGTLSIDRDLQFAFIRRGKLAACDTQHESRKPSILADLLRMRNFFLALQTPSPLSKPLPVVSIGSLGRRPDQLCSDRQVHGSHLPGCQSFLEFSMPSKKWIHPRDDRVMARADAIDGELRPPAVVDQRRHQHFAPAAQRISFELSTVRGRLVRPVAHRRSHRVMAVAENIRFDDYAFSHDTFDRKSAGVDLRLDAFDHHAIPSRRVRIHGLFQSA